MTIRGGEGKPAPGTVETREVPRHKKNPAVGTKTTFYADRVFVEQADAASFAQDEEVRSLSLSLARSLFRVRGWVVALRGLRYGADEVARARA